VIVPGQSAPAAGSAVAGLPPPKIADHELLHVIGRGAYGEVWLARHVQLCTLRAIKIVRRDQFGDARPFNREFDGIQKYEPISRSHPNLVSILHVGGTDDCFYYVMELADAAPNRNDECRKPKEIRNPNTEPAAQDANLRTSGFEVASSFDIRHSALYSPHTLRSELKQHGALPMDRVLEIAHALASALAHLHANKLVHRDVKPSNVIFVDSVPKLADIGLVAGVDDARSLVGTEGYVPLDGAGKPSADCYALGKLLYELITGHDRNSWPEPPADLATRPDRERLLELNAILHCACTPDPRQRYQSAREMQDDLSLLLRGKSVKARHTRAQRWAVAKKGAIALTLLTVLVTSTSVLWREFKRSRSGPESNLSMELGRLDEGKVSTNSEANVLYHRAMGVMREDNYQKLGEAYTNFIEATRLDPNFAKAYAALVEMYVRERFVGMPPNQGDRLRKLSAKLEALAPASSATYVARACVQYMDWQFDEAKKSWEKAIVKNPNNEFAHTSYGFALTRWGDSTNALKQLSMADDLEPSKGVIQLILGEVYYLKREYPSAFAQYKKGLRFTPNSFYAHQSIGRVLQAMHRELEAIDEFEKAQLIDGADEDMTKKSFDELRDAFNKNGGEKACWEERLRRTEKEPDSHFYWKAVIHVHLGHTDEVFRWLNKSFETREDVGHDIHHELNDLLVDEYWDSLRGDPRFKELVMKVGFPGK
jgi:serine/threonine protein kinase